MELVWHDVRTIGVDGKGWQETEAPYIRLPSKARATVPEVVWDLSRHSTGLSTEFTTDASEIHARWTVVSDELNMPHMPTISVSGLDLYATDPSGHWRWAGTAWPEHGRTGEMAIGVDLDASLRAYRLYFLLFNEVESLEIGVPAGAIFRPIAPRTTPPIVIYGTSITHGACASRSGMCHPAIIGRRLNQPVINLGFSGSAKMELSIAELLAELDASVYVIDALPNMEGSLIEERALPFLRALRAARPTTPIVVVEDRTYTNAWITPTKAKRHSDSRAAMKAAYAAVTADDATGWSYVEGDALLGDDDEGTVDSSHPTDLGFVRQADLLTPVIAAALGKTTS